MSGGAEQSFFGHFLPRDFSGYFPRSFSGFFQCKSCTESSGLDRPVDGF